MNPLQALREKRATLLAAVKEILARAKARPEAEQDLTAEESAQVDKLYAEFDAAGKRLDTLERQSQLERAEQQLQEVTRRTADPDTRSIATGDYRPDYAEAVRAWMCRSHNPPAEAVQHAHRAGLNLAAGCITIRFARTGVVIDVYAGEPDDRRPVRRDVLTTTGSSAMVQWREFTAEYDKALQFRGYVLNVVKRIKTATGVGLPVPKIDDTANRGRWLAEGSPATNTDPTLGSYTLGAFKACSDKVPISIEALQDDQVTMNEILPGLLGERIGGLYNQAATKGAGTTEPFGLTTDAGNSSVVIGGTNAAPTYSWDDMLSLKYSVDYAYRQAPPSQRGFMMSDTLFGKYRKLKDTATRYYADPFTSAPGTIDGDPVFLNNDMVSTGVNGKVALYGDYGRYWWRDVLEVTIYRLDQIAMLDGKIVFVSFSRADGKLLNVAAVKYLGNPAS